MREPVGTHCCGAKTPPSWEKRDTTPMAMVCVTHAVFIDGNKTACAWLATWEICSNHVGGCPESHW